MLWISLSFYQKSKTKNSFWKVIEDFFVIDVVRYKVLIHFNVVSNFQWLHPFLKYKTSELIKKINKEFISLAKTILIKGTLKNETMKEKAVRHFERLRRKHSCCSRSGRNFFIRSIKEGKAKKIFSSKSRSSFY